MVLGKFTGRSKSPSRGPEARGGPGRKSGSGMGCKARNREGCSWRDGGDSAVGRGLESKKQRHLPTDPGVPAHGWSTSSVIIILEREGGEFDKKLVLSYPKGSEHDAWDQAF